MDPKNVVNTIFMRFIYLKKVWFILGHVRVETFQLRRRDMIDISREVNGDIDMQFKFLFEQIKKKTNCTYEQESEVSKKVAYLKTEFKTRWLKAHRMESRFQQVNKQWLESFVLFPLGARVTS